MLLFCVNYISAQVITPQIKELCSKCKYIYYQEDKIIIQINDESGKEFEIDTKSGIIRIHKKGEISVNSMNKSDRETMRFLKTFYEDCAYNADEMSMVAVKSKDNHKWGFVGIDGEKRIKCEYEIVTPFSKDGLAFVRKKNKFQYIDTYGQTIIKDIPYLDSWAFGNVDYNKIDYDYIVRFSERVRFSEGLAFVPGKKMLQMNNAIYFDCINTKGDVAFSLEGGLYPMYPFSEGMTVVKKYNKDVMNVEDIKIGYGYINKKGEIVIPCDFDNALPFRGNYAIVEIEKRNTKGKSLILYGIIDKLGNCTLPIEHKNIKTESLYDYYVK